ncbi:MAG: diguanylate cyclase [Spirochaetales bacterium]|nr:diguanylate cyclase [Spirochaetales bacterium]
MIGLIISLTFSLYYLTTFFFYKKERYHLVLSAFLLSMSLYLAGYSFYSSALDAPSVLFWTRICYSGGALIIFTSYVLSSEILDRYNRKLTGFLALTACLLIFILYSPSDAVFTEILNPEKTHSSVIKGPLFPFILITMLVLDFLLLIRFILGLMRDKEKLHLITPILIALCIWMVEATIDGIFGAYLGLTDKKYSLGPFILVFSLALNSSRYLEKKHRKLIQVMEENRKISESLIYDKLSTLYSREYFLKTLEQRTALSKRREVYDCLMFIDVDGFKSVNDQMGHEWGDKVIQHLGKTLWSCSRQTDICARYGGDEFLILLEDCGSKDALHIANNINAHFKKDIKESLENWKGADQLSLSTGIVEFMQWPGNAADLIRRADQAMYEAKKKGKNRSVIYSKIQETGSTVIK